MTKDEEGQLESSAQYRIEIWERSVEIAEKNPVLGVGFNTFPYLGFSLADTHNIYIKVLAEQGVIGLLLILLILFLAIQNGWKLYKHADDSFLKGLGLGFVICTIVIIITNMFGDRWSYVPLAGFFWIFLALVVRGNLIVNKQLNGENSN